AFADLERLLPWFEHPMDQHRVRAVWPNGAERLGLVERLPFDPDEYDRERDELAAGTDLGVSRELREASLAEHARRHVRVRAMLAPRTQEDAPILQRREERVARDAWRVPVTDGQVALPAPDLFGTRDLLEHQPLLLGRKYAMSRIEPMRSATGFHTASTFMPIFTSAGLISPKIGSASGRERVYI